MLHFFEGAAFSDNPKWRSCYCQFLFVDNSVVQWSTRSAADNKSAACERIACGRMQGLLAYRNGEVGGWRNAARRTLLDAFADKPDPDAHRLGQITCFVVAKRQRRTGVASALLEAACVMLTEEGLHIAEASPSRQARSDAEHHHGPLSVYLKAGFAIHREGQDGTVPVRRSLLPRSGQWE